MLGKPGPFQVIRDSISGATDRPTTAPRRRYSCTNYLVCLDLAAALNWDNFTCRGCSGCINESLLWRGHQVIRKDKVVRKLCILPEIRSIEKPESTQMEPLVLGKKVV